MKKLVLMSMVSVLIVACSPKKDAAVRTTNVDGSRNAQGIVNGTNGTTPVANTCSQNQFPIGTIYDSGNQQASLYNSGSYEERVKSFLSATINPQEIGQISSAQWENTGVRFQGVIKLDQNGNVQLAQSKIIIKVYDSLIFQSSGAQAIPVSIDAASEGRFDLQTGTGYVVYKDQYGEVRLDGRFDAQNFSGTVSYKNYVSYNQSTPAQGQLGQFLIARCAIIQ
jgi:hypothetical protein